MLTRKLRAQYLEAAKELRRYFNCEDYRTLTPEHSFIQWYVTARFGRVSAGNNIYCDGKNDGGIDAIVFHDRGATIFQMKYETLPRVGTVTRDELSGFETVAKRIADQTQQASFDIWLGTVRPELRRHYRKLRDMPQDQLNFVFVTSKYSELTSRTVEIEDIKKVLSLWSLYREGFTPPSESMVLTLEKDWYSDSKKGFKTYVGIANVQDFVRLMRRDKNDRLFAQNVRTEMKTPINREIKTTYEDNPEEFWLGNNGVYIVCRLVNQSGRDFTLMYPSVINGSQTLHSIAASGTSHECKILVRILEMDVIGNRLLLDEVIRRTNTQNTMKLTNLVAHDICQLNIARYLDEFNVFYERRENEWLNEKKSVMPGYIPVKIKDVGQWLSLLDIDIGMGKARSRPAELYNENLYKRIFGGFDSDLRSPKFRKLCCAIWVGLFFKKVLRAVPRNKKSLYKIPRLLLIRSLIEAISSRRELQDAAIAALRAHRFGGRKVPAKLNQHLRRAVLKLATIQKRAQKKDDNLDYSNYFKVDDHCTEAYKSAFTPRAIQSTARILAGVLDDVT